MVWPKKKPPHLSDSHVIIINNDPLAVRLYCPTIDTASNRLSKSVSADGRSTENRKGENGGEQRVSSYKIPQRHLSLGPLGFRVCTNAKP